MNVSEILQGAKDIYRYSQYMKLLYETGTTNCLLTLILLTWRIG